jgi:hypothetical protein
VEADFGRLLREKRNGSKKEQKKNRAFHVRLPRDFVILLGIIRALGESVAC